MSARKEQPRRTGPPAPELLPALIESLLFVADEPQEIGTLAKSLNVSRKGVEKAVDALVGAKDGRGVFAQRQGDLVQLATIPDAAPYIERFVEVDYGRLSRAALETLAIIAYRQPVTRATIESIRGVNSDHAVATLAARGLIEDVGRAPGPGRPVLFACTVRFLQHFGLQQVGDLPTLPDIEPAGRQVHLAPVSSGETEAPEEAEALDEGEAAEEPEALDESEAAEETEKTRESEAPEETEEFVAALPAEP